MDTAREFGPELRRRRAARSMSLSDLAAIVHYDRGYLSRVERGLRTPTTALARLCDAAVGANGALVALAAGESEEGVPPPALPPVPVSSGLVGLFQQIAKSAMLFSDDHERTLAGARRLFGVLRAEGHVNAPASILPALAVQFGVLRAAARQAREPIRQRLVLLAAYYAEYAGWMIQECGDDAGATGITHTAAALARLAGEPGLAAYALIRQADIALYRGDGASVVALALRAAGEDSPAAVRALAVQRAAQGWALIGRPVECRDALARAEEQQAMIAVQPDDIPLGSRGGGQLMDVVRGWCYLDLGLPDEAAEALRVGLDVAPPAAHRARALYGARLALSYAAGGDRRQARQAGTVALNEAFRVDSASVRHQLHSLATVIRRWPTDDDMCQFRIEIDNALIPSRSGH